MNNHYHEKTMNKNKYFNKAEAIGWCSCHKSPYHSDAECTRQKNKYNETKT
jgi:hypothetical protein